MYLKVAGFVHKQAGFVQRTDFFVFRIDESIEICFIFATANEPKKMVTASKIFGESAKELKFLIYKLIGVTESPQYKHFENNGN